MGTDILSYLVSSEVTIRTNKFLTNFLKMTYTTTSVWVTSHSNAERLKQVSHRISVVPKTPQVKKKKNIVKIQTVPHNFLWVGVGGEGAPNFSMPMESKN